MIGNFGNVISSPGPSPSSRKTLLPYSLIFSSYSPHVLIFYFLFSLIFSSYSPLILLPSYSPPIFPHILLPYSLIFSSHIPSYSPPIFPYSAPIFLTHFQPLKSSPRNSARFPTGHLVKTASISPPPSTGSEMRDLS